MEERRTYQRPIKVELICEEHGEPMTATNDEILMSNPPQYPHKCPKGHTVRLGITQRYPYIEWEDASGWVHETVTHWIYCRECGKRTEKGLRVFKVDDPKLGFCSAECLNKYYEVKQNGHGGNRDS